MRRLLTVLKQLVGIVIASPNLAHRWYLGYHLDEPLPDHSSLTRIRQRLGVSIFRRFFEHSDHARDLVEANAARHDWVAEEGRPDRTVIRGSYRRLSDYQASSTDPDASLMATKTGGRDLGYHDHYVVDGGKARIILNVLHDPSGGHGEPTHARPALANLFPLAPLPAPGHWRHYL